MRYGTCSLSQTLVKEECAASSPLLGAPASSSLVLGSWYAPARFTVLWRARLLCTP